MRSLLAWAVLLAACQFNPDTLASSTDDGSPSPGRADANPSFPDANLFMPDADPSVPDAAPGSPDAATCSIWARTPSLFDPCMDITQEGDNLVLNQPGEYTYDTNSGTLRPPGGGTAISHTSSFLGMAARAPQVITVGRFEIASGSSLRATGNRPLMIVSWGEMVIDGELDVSSRAANDVGAGGNSNFCNAAQEGTSDVNGGGGGGGGGFGAVGGKGGTGRIGQNPGNAPGGDGGAAKVAAVHGGCPGARGGFGDSMIESERGALGEGGGAVYLVARTTMTVSNVINAGGMGGGGASTNRAAGGGGGSGGLVGLEAAVITLEAGTRLAANGGGGGGGGNNNPSQPGANGTINDNAASGGAGDSANGGDGGALNVPEGQLGLSNNRGAGGGGGGVGYIVLLANAVMDNTETISPAEQTNPIALP